MNKKQFLKYIDHFNNKKYDAVMGYYVQDVTFEFYDNATYSGPPARTLHGLQEFIDSYKSLHKYVREVLELRDFLSKGNMMAAELYTEFHCYKDAPALYGSPARKKGEVRVMTNWVIYNLEAGKIKHIRIAHFRMHDPKLAKFY
jgi:hypothetical protein